MYVYAYANIYVGMSKIAEIRSLIDPTMNQTDFAALIGVRQSQVSRWERGQNKPSPKAIAAILRVAQKRGLPVSFEDFAI